MANILSKKKNTGYCFFSCEFCNKKVQFTPTYNLLAICHCDNLYCRKHRFPEKHNCTYDYKSEEIEKLKKNLPSIVAHKVPNRI